MFFLEITQQMGRKEQLQSAYSISLLDVQKVDNNPLIVSTGFVPQFLTTICAIWHVELHCLLRCIARAC